MDSRLCSLATTAKYPCGNMPLCYLDLNGRPFGMAVIARPRHESTILKVMSSWQAALPKRKPPPQMVEYSANYGLGGLLRKGCAGSFL